MLQLNDVCYKAGSRFLVKDVTLNFTPGHLHLILGPNGAGKSTLIKLISGQLKPASGNISWNNNDIRNYSIAQLARIRALLSQNIDLSFPLAVKEVVMMGRYPHFSNEPREKDEIACNEAMALFDLLGLEERSYTTLSGGEKQRVQFARIVCQLWYAASDERAYLLLDEPLTFLDIHYQHKFMEQIKAFAREHSVVTVAIIHDPNIACKYGDTVTLLDNGAVVASGIPEEVFTIENITNIYKITPRIIRDNEQQYILF